MPAIEANLKDIWRRIGAAAQRAGRDIRDIRLVVVSKNQPLERIREAAVGGAAIFGENKAQEFAEKREREPGLEWHFIGHLQTNKVGLVTGRAALVHSVDSVRLAAKISERALEAGIIQNVLMQVNVSGEESKYGVAQLEAGLACKEIGKMQGIALRGLMTMAPLEPEPELARPVFRGLRLLKDELKKECPDAQLDWLSMGMTGDFEVAVEEGGNLLRIGTAVFGP